MSDLRAVVDRLLQHEIEVRQRTILAQADYTQELESQIQDLEAQLREMTAERDRYREAHYWLWSKGQRVRNGATGAVDGLHEVLLRYSGPEWAEWTPWDEEDQ